MQEGDEESSLSTLLKESKMTDANSEKHLVDGRKASNTSHSLNDETGSHRISFVLMPSLSGVGLGSGEGRRMDFDTELKVQFPPRLMNSSQNMEGWK